MAAYRSTRHDSTAYTPNYLMLGREVRAPVDIMYGTGGLNEEQSYDGFVKDVQLRIQTAFELVRKHIGQAAERNKRYYDIRVKPAKYKIGQWVYYLKPPRFRGIQDKWSRKYTVPFIFFRILGPVNVELRLNKKSKPFICHIDKIKPYYVELPKCWLDVNVESEVAEVVGSANDEAEVLDVAEDESNESVVVNNGPVIEPLALEPADVITSNADQEVRRVRPRRNVRLPARYR